jgi:hypothetical protein
VDYRCDRINSISPGSNASGAFSLSPAFTQSDPYTKSAGTTTDTSMATLLLGLGDSSNFGYNSSTYIQNSYNGLFVQHASQISRAHAESGVRQAGDSVPGVQSRAIASIRCRAAGQVPRLDQRGILFAGAMIRADWS